MKKIYSTILLAFIAVSAMAQGWPASYGGVMLQGFYWDSFTDTQWTNLEKQADELSQYFSLIWVPQSGNCNTSSNVMGYKPVYYFDQNSSFGSEEQLRSMIKTFKSKGLGTIADVVVNHRDNLGVNGSWVDYPPETYNGVTYQMLPTDICANDDGEATKNWADANGISLSSTNDEGEGWPGCRDLDHTSANVQKCIKAYVKYLKEDLGYTGFRYDMVKGFNGNHVGDYNDAAGVEFSVGEYWDGNASTVMNWINGTGKRSAAFDFAFRYTVRNAIRGYRDGGSGTAPNWSLLGDDAVIKVSNGDYKRYAVTFVENHDTQYRSAGEQQDPIRKDTLAANAYLLAMPGTPCVFLPHWQAYKQEIKAMIDARKAAGITNTSKSVELGRNNGYYAVVTDQKLAAVVGNNAGSFTSNSLNQYTQILSGYHYRYYMNKSANIAWVDKASGLYYEPFDANVTAVTNNSSAQLVYTLDGSKPTASSQKVTGGKVNISKSCTLTVGLLIGGSVTGITKRNYNIEEFVAHTATVYFKDPGWSKVNFYCWDANGESGVGMNGKWPGKAITNTKVINGVKWYYQTFNISKAGYKFNIIFNNVVSNVGNQTVDIANISEDTYFELSSMTGGKYTVNDVTDTMTGINDVTVDKPSYGDNAYYTLTGVRVAKPTQPGIYIHNGRKVVVK